MKKDYRKLTDAEVAHIRAAHAQYLHWRAIGSARALYDQYKDRCSLGTINNIVYRTGSYAENQRKETK